MLRTTSWTAACTTAGRDYLASQGLLWTPDKHDVEESLPWRVGKGGERLEGIQGSQGLHGCPEGRVQGSKRAHETRPGLLRGQLQPLRGPLQLCHGRLHLRGPVAMHLLGGRYSLPILQAEVIIGAP